MNNNKTYRVGFRKGVIVELPVENEVRHQTNTLHLERFSEEAPNSDVREFEEHRRDFIAVMKKLHKEHPIAKVSQLEIMASREVVGRERSRSKALSRIQSTKKLTGLVMSSIDPSSAGQHSPAVTTPSRRNDRRITKVFFSPGHYTVEERVGQFSATVVRQNGNLNRRVLVDYASEDADALAGRNYRPIRGTLCFQPGETQKNVDVIIDDMVYGGDLHFYIRLFDIRYGENSEKGQISPDAYFLSFLPDPFQQLRSRSIGSRSLFYVGSRQPRNISESQSDQVVTAVEHNRQNRHDPFMA